MVVEILILLIASAFSVLITYFAVPVGHGYHYFAPILLWIAGYIVGVIIMWCVLFLFALPVNQKKERNKPLKWASFWLTESIAYINNHARIKTRIESKVAIPQNERYLLIANHRSKFDPMILTQKYGHKDLAFISKPSNFKIPIGHRFMRGACYFAIDRYDKMQSLQVMKGASELIKNQVSNVGVFPEGTRSEDCQLGPFHEGVFNIAMWSKAPIVVTSFMGTEKIHKNFPLHRTIVTLKVLEVLYPSDYEGMTPKAISDHCYKVIKESLTDLK